MKNTLNLSIPRAIAYLAILFSISCESEKKKQDKSNIIDSISIDIIPKIDTLIDITSRLPCKF